MDNTIIGKSGIEKQIHSRTPIYIATVGHCGMKLYQEKNKGHVEVETSSFRGTLHLTPSGLFTP